MSTDVSLLFRNAARPMCVTPSVISTDVSLFDENSWFYIQREKINQSVFKLGKSKIQKNNILEITFNNYGIVESKKLYDLDDMNDIKHDIKDINKNSKDQAVKIKDDVATTAEEKKAFNESNGKINEGSESGNEQKDLTLSSVQAGTDAVAKAGESVVTSIDADGLEAGALAELMSEEE